MTTDRPGCKRWLQFGIGTLLFATFCVAGFLTGYRRGFHVGQEAESRIGIYAKAYDVRDIVRLSPNGRAIGQTLVRYLQESIMPRSWQENGGPSAVAYYENNQTIVISNNQDAQDQVADALKQIRLLQRQGKASEVESILVSVGR